MTILYWVTVGVQHMLILSWVIVGIVTGIIMVLPEPPAGKGR